MRGSPSRRTIDAYATLILWVVVTLLAVWRAAFVLAGVDLDTDAYGHHTIARQIVETPRALGVHWVWLPLFHYVQAAFIALFDLRLDGVRLANVVLTAATPLSLYALLRAARARQEAHVSKGRDAIPWDFTPFLAAVLVALSPIAMQMGTTGQPEPAFTLLVLLTVALLVERRFVGASLVLSVAVLVRYEAWAIPPAIVASRLVERFLPARASEASAERDASKGSLRWLWPVLLPIAVVVAWAAARRPVDGAWFWFLKGTRSFANDAQGAHASLDRSAAALLSDAFYYPIEIAHLCLGASLWLVPCGVPRLWRRQGARFVLPYLAILGFLSAVWIARGSLGLTRHFAVMVPIYATAAAHGVMAVASCLERVAATLRHRAHATAIAIAACAGLGCFLMVDTARTLDAWMIDWRDKSWLSWPDRREIAAYLAAAPPHTRILCDEPTIEVLSGLDRRRFDRAFLGDDEPTRRRIDAAAASGDGVLIVTWRGKIPALQRDYDVALAPNVEPGAPSLVVLRVAPR